MESFKKPLHSNGKHSPKSIDKLLSTNILSILPKKIDFVKGVKKDVELDILKSKYVPLSKTNEVKKDNPQKKAQVKSGKMEEDDLLEPSHQLCDESEVLNKWENIVSIGSGLHNQGNTCFMNSVLQCLTYTPPLANLALKKSHSSTCKRGGSFCLFCAMERHILSSASRGIITPKSFIINLKAISPTLRYGRQEDSHEFLRCVIEGMQKACLHGLPKNLDPKIAATSVVHRIFGGYLQSQVHCSQCGYKSNTFDPFLDLSLEINGCDTVEKALHKFTRPEVLDNENKYKCPRCSKKVQAQKRFTIKKSPNILTIQLKRFKFGYGGFGGGKINKKISFSENLNLQPFMSQANEERTGYKLYAVLVHAGHSTNSGHYYCFIKNSADVWHCMNDESVRQVSVSAVLQQEAYILFYVRDSASTTKTSMKRKADDQKENSNYINGNSNKGNGNKQNGNSNNFKKQKIEESSKSPVLVKSSPTLAPKRDSPSPSPNPVISTSENGHTKVPVLVKSSPILPKRDSPTLAPKRDTPSPSPSPAANGHNMVQTNVSKASVPTMKKMESEQDKNKKKTEEFMRSISLSINKDQSLSEPKVLVQTKDSSHKKKTKDVNDNSSQDINSVSGSSDEDPNRNTLRVNLKRINSEEHDSQDSNVSPISNSSDDLESSKEEDTKKKELKQKKKKVVQEGKVMEWNESLEKDWKSGIDFDDTSAFLKKKSTVRSLTANSGSMVPSWDGEVSSTTSAEKRAIERDLDQAQKRKKARHDWWDDTLDTGKLKKKKEKRIIDENEPNPFQVNHKQYRKGAPQFKSNMKSAYFSSMKASYNKMKRKL